MSNAVTEHDGAKGDQEPILGPGGNPPPAGPAIELAQLFLAADEASGQAGVTDGDDGAAKPEPRADAAKLKAPRGPAPDGKDEPAEEENIPLGFKNLRRKRRDIARREAKLVEREALLDSLSRASKLDDPVARWEALAKVAGVDGAELYGQVTTKRVAPPGAKADESLPPAVSLEQIRAQIKAEIEAADTARTQQSRAQYLDARVDELTAIRRSPELAKRFPVLACLPEQRMIAEVAQAVAFAAERYPAALRDMPAFARTLDDALREELAATMRSMKNVDNVALNSILGDEGNGSPAPSPGGKPATKVEAAAKATDASRRKTITDHDTSSGGGHAGREDTPEEMRGKLRDLFESQRIR